MMDTVSDQVKQSKRSERQLMEEIEREPWERAPGESPRAFEAWVLYQNMGAGRSAARVARECGKHVSLITRWSAQHHWVERAAAWDAHVAKKAREAHIEAIEEMNRRHAQLGKALQSVGAKKLKALQAEDAVEMKARDARDYIAEGTRIERVAMGAPDSVTELRQAEAEADQLTPGRLARAIVSNEQAMEKALDLLDAVAEAERAVPQP